MPMEEEKTFDKTQYPFITQALRKLELEKRFFMMIKGIDKKKIYS